MTIIARRTIRETLDEIEIRDEARHAPANEPRGEVIEMLDELPARLPAKRAPLREAIQALIALRPRAA